MIRVLYIGAGNPAAPVTGMDLVCAAHLDELGGVADLAVTTVVTAPAGTKPLPDPAAPIQCFVGDVVPGGRVRALLDLCRGRALQYRGFWSAGARREIARLLREPTDVVVIDHYIALSNIRLTDLARARRRGVKIVFIGHNMTARAMLDAARLSGGKARLIFLLQAVQSLAVEATLLGLARHAVFISGHDERFYRRLAGDRAQTLFPIPVTTVSSPAAHPMTTATRGRAFVTFLGSPGFAPNAAAIDWIVKALAPALARIAPGIEVVLVGKGTDRAEFQSINVTGLGFVADADLRDILGEASALICPVTYGSGIKIKILDAIMTGCPVLATEESLRGFDFMGFAPALFLKDVDRSARAVAAFVSDADKVTAARAAVRDRWDAFRSERLGKLAALIASDADKRDVMTASSR